MDTSKKYAVIGAGPAGLSGARNLQRFNIDFDGYEKHSDVGGLWDIENPHSTVYETAHLISSKKMTEFTEFPMDESVADYPSHHELRKYFRDFAREYKLYDHYRFNSAVANISPGNNGWQLALENGDTLPYAGVIIANGTLSEPNIPFSASDFSGEIMHSAKYKSPKIFAGKRVLIIGAGNSGCDIAVDAIHFAKKVSISVRRGYHFVPKYVFGRPADTMGGLIRLPARFKQAIDSRLLKLFTGDPVKLGFPEPDHKMYESHPIVNTLILYHLGHGDIDVKADLARFDGHTVHFKNGASEEYDLVVMATGYKLHYPFIEKKHLNWNGKAPQLYLNAFHPEYDNLFILGMVEAAGIGWQGRYELAELIARFIVGAREGSKGAVKFKKLKSKPPPDMKGGFNYMDVERMAYYVHKDTFLKLLRKNIELLKK